ncbi:gas vesicle protein GvpO [Streptosporangium sp. NPDC000396]|uniref:gas vesicle protein GvpO n=1 Tax=Streptosporangium sp. NPDC000396 TaxID=3366185 RepID=UPI0036C2AE80
MPARRRPADSRASDDRYEKVGDEAVDEDQDDLYEEEEEDLGEEEEFGEAKAPKAARRSRHLSAMTAGAAGLRHIGELTGREPEGVTKVKPMEDGWTVEVEVVEDRRVPSTGDVLALYEAEIDEEGDLLSYRRLRRYRRGSGDTYEAS